MKNGRARTLVQQGSHLMLHASLRKELRYRPPAYISATTDAYTWLIAGLQMLILGIVASAVGYSVGALRCSIA